LMAIITGQFNLFGAAKTFFVVAIMGILVGLAIAMIVFFIHRRFPTTASIDAAISIIAPYIMYVTAEHFHYSGVLSVMTH